MRILVGGEHAWSLYTLGWDYEAQYYDWTGCCIALEFWHGMSLTKGCGLQGFGLHCVDNYFDNACFCRNQDNSAFARVPTGGSV